MCCSAPTRPTTRRFDARRRQHCHATVARHARPATGPDGKRLRAIEDAFRGVCTAWGYREIRTPVIEPLHLFTSAGTLSPQTLDRVYSFLDWDGWSGERVVLRPDSTIPAARLYAEHANGSVARHFYVQNVFRFADDDAPREEWQCGVELIGETGALGDVELVLLALDALGRLDAGAPHVRLSHAGIARAVLAAAGLTPDEQSKAYDRLLDGDMSVVDEVEARLPQLNAPLRLLFEVDGAGSGYLANVRGALAAAIPALTGPLDELAFVVATLEARGVAPVIQSALTRNFEYYSGIVMKIDVGGQRAAIGGRYDGLVGLVGGPAVAASGFALYLAPLIEMVSPPPDDRPRVSVRPIDRAPKSVAAAFEAAARLRDAGWRVETVAHPRGGAPELVCDAALRVFTLRDGAKERAFDSLDGAIAALGRGRP
jgi:histidyl-tRNA synthetase